MKEILPAGKLKACSFERIYFSRGNDAEIYNERKALGRHLFPKVKKAINNDFKNTVFSYIPNTAETHIQKIAPGPPTNIAVATPAILPVPTVAESAVVSD